MTAEDAAWSIQRVIKMGQVGSTDIALWGFTPENVEKLVRAKDAHTLESSSCRRRSRPIWCSTRWPGSRSASSTRRRHCQHEKNGDLGGELAEAPIPPAAAHSSLAQWRPNDIADLRMRSRNIGAASRPWRRVVMRHIPESGNLRLQIEAGDVDVGQYVSSGDLDALPAKKDMVDRECPGSRLLLYRPQQKDPDLQKPKVREAFQHMPSTGKRLAATTMSYTGFPWQSIIPSGMSALPVRRAVRYEYDPARPRSCWRKPDIRTA